MANVDVFRPQASALLTTRQADGRRCEWLESHSERPAVAVQVVNETGEIFYVCDECALDLGIYDDV